MKRAEPYSNKFDRIKNLTLFPLLNENQQKWLAKVALEYQFTLQELRIIAVAMRDLEMWQEKPLSEWWVEAQPCSNSSSGTTSTSGITGRNLKKKIFKSLSSHLEKIRKKNKQYVKQCVRDKNGKISNQGSKSFTFIPVPKKDNKISGMCPVMSDKTVCCNLRTIDAIHNCGFQCNYCCIQSFYPEKQIQVEENLAYKLDQIQLELDSNRLYHFGTGQSSDSLMWGNKGNVLDSLMNFANQNPNVLLEFKTKSVNIDYLSKEKIPQNVFVSWSLNTDTIISCEESMTATLDKRIKAAKLLVAKGIKAGFHLHPMIKYAGWKTEYQQMINNLIQNFDHQNVLFVSFGSLTLSKPIIQKIRQQGNKTKVLQMPMEPNPEGKLTYPAPDRIELFNHAYKCFQAWHHKVYFYLCMEEALFWKKVFGFVYSNNEDFELDLVRNIANKLENTGFGYK